jgi:hypothetical protein
MRTLKVLLAFAAVVVCLIASDRGESQQIQKSSAFLQSQDRQAVSNALHPNSLCARTEHIVFSCQVRRSGMGKGLAKIVSLCASVDLDKEHGYLQYRFGLPGKVELEFPESRTGTQQKFQYTHYLRYQVDLTEINFAIDDYQYQIFDTYNGEEKPPISTEGVTVTAPDKKDVSYVCRGKAKADYGKLGDVLTPEQ